MKTKALIIFLFSAFMSFGQSESVASQNYNVENLATLGKVWGYLKYYHPAVAAGNYHWDSALLEKIPLAMNISEKAEFNDSLLSWVNSMPDGEVEVKSFDTANICLYADLDWISDTQQLGVDLSTKLRKIASWKRTGSNAYVKPYSYSYFPSFDNDQFDGDILQPSIRLLSLFRLWNCMQYYFPYRDVIGENWHDVLVDEIPNFIDISHPDSYELALAKLLSRLNDAHVITPVKSTNVETYLYGGSDYAPVDLQFIENQAVVTGYRNKELGEASGLLPGDIIISVDGEQTEDKIQRLKAYTSSSNDTYKMNVIAFRLLQGNGPIQVQYKRDESMLHKEIMTYSWSELNQYDSNHTAIPEVPYKLLSDSIGYFRSKNLDDTNVKSMMSLFENTKGIVFDFRCYPKSYSAMQGLMNFFLKKGDTEFVWSRVNFKEPGQFIFGRSVRRNSYGSVSGQVKNQYNGHIVVLVDSRTMSQAEFFTVFLNSFPRTTVIGDTTAAADGNVMPLYFPGDYSSRFSSIGIFYPDRGATQRVGIRIDSIVRPTIQGIKEGRDEQLEKAIEILQAKEWPMSSSIQHEKNVVEKQMFSIYPVPAKDQLYIDSKIEGSCSIVDVFGRVLQKNQLTVGINEISLAKLNAGVYNVIIRSKNGLMSNQKVIVN